MFYLNAYVPTLQSSGQVVAFMTQHLGKPIPSPACCPTFKMSMAASLTMNT